MKLRDNQYGFDIHLDNPFRIFRYLREIAIEKVGEKNVADLSRGDPGYGFSPSVKGREFYSFLIIVDTLLNRPGEHFVTDNHDSFEMLMEKIRTHTYAIYNKEYVELIFSMLSRFIDTSVRLAHEQGLDWDRRRILFEIFKYSAVSGGQYHDPQGEILTRLVIADHHNKKLDLGITYKDLVLTRGVSDGIGTLFKFLCDKKISYLQPGDSVLITSPVYAPYNTIMENRGLSVFSVPMDVMTGQVNGDIEELLKTAPDTVKLICIIDPNNPTGHMFPESFLERIAQFAEEKNALIIADEVYSDFFDYRKKSMMSFARNRTIVMSARSKIERSTGLRFGEYIITPEADEYIAKNILNCRLNGSQNLKSLLMAAKAPGGADGEFQHTTFVTGPSQFLGISHVLFGGEDREAYKERIKKNMETFYEILGLPYHGNVYYATFDLREIGEAHKDKSAEEIFLGLAEKGVVLIPANLFFSAQDREKKDYSTFARASLANLNPEQLKKAATYIKEFSLSSS